LSLLQVRSAARVGDVATHSKRTLEKAPLVKRFHPFPQYCHT
jgi:hypothetical protein